MVLPKVDWKIAIVAFFGFHLLPMFVTGVIQTVHSDASIGIGSVTTSVGITADLTALILAQPWWEFIAPFGVGYAVARFARFGPLTTAILVELIAFLLRLPQLYASGLWLIPVWATYDLLGVAAGWYVGRRPVVKPTR